MLSRKIYITYLSKKKNLHNSYMILRVHAWNVQITPKAQVQVLQKCPNCHNLKRIIACLIVILEILSTSWKLVFILTHEETIKKNKNCSQFLTIIAVQSLPIIKLPLTRMFWAQIQLFGVGLFYKTHY